MIGSDYCQGRCLPTYQHSISAHEWAWTWVLFISPIIRRVEPHPFLLSIYYIFVSIYLSILSCHSASQLKLWIWLFCVSPEVLLRMTTSVCWELIWRLNSHVCSKHLLLVLGLVVTITNGQSRFPKRLDLSIAQYKDRPTGQVLNSTLDNFCRDVSVFSRLKFKETERERFGIDMFQWYWPESCLFQLCYWIR